MSPNQPKRPTRPIRVDLHEWAVFGDATTAMDTDRSAALRAFMAWYVHAPGAKLPERPARSVALDARQQREEAAGDA